MFKMSKSDLSFALSLCSHSLAQRQQEEVIYRSVRVLTFEQDKKPYVCFMSNGGYHAVKTAGFPITDYTAPVDVLIECQKLQKVIEKATVDSIIIQVQNEETVLVTANGENKIRYHSSDTLPEFPEAFEDGFLGEMKVGSFGLLFKQTVPFSTVDVHKTMKGLCLEKNSLYATDESKGVTLFEVGFNTDMQLNFSPVAADMLGMFDSDKVLQVGVAKFKQSPEYTHLYFQIDSMEMFILKWSDNYPSSAIDKVNELCKMKHTSSFTASKEELLGCLGRIGVFVDENDLLVLNPSQDGVMLEVLNAKTGEESKEFIPCIVEGDKDLRVYVSLTNFKVLVENVKINPVPISYDNPEGFVSCQDGDFLAWLTTKKVE